MKPAVLIVGAGPVGLATAALLRQHGVAVRIIERGDGPTPYSKAVGVHARTLESMHALGLTEQLISDGHPLHRFALHQAGHAIIDAGFGEIDSPYPFVLGLPQSRTERRLLARFEQLGGRVEWNTELARIHEVGASDGAPAQVEIRRPDGSLEHAQMRWIIGADGSRSTVREQAGIAFPGGDYSRAFILGDVRVDWAGPKHRLQFFLAPHGYLLLVPMPDGLHRVIAQTGLRYDDFQRSDRPQATLEALQAVVDANGPPGMRVHSPQWVTCAPFYHRKAETPVKGRVVLVGDAFHLFSPLGAQGLNTGFQDAFNLAWKLAFIEKGWADLRLLQSYADERTAIATRVAQVTSKTTRFITATEPHLRWLRYWFSRAVNRRERVQRTLPRLLAGELQSYGPNALLSDPATAPGLPAPGARVPHAWVPDPAGAHAYRPLASLLHGTRYTVLALIERADADSARELAQAWAAADRERLPFVQWLVVTRELGPAMPALPPHASWLEDRLGAVFAAFGQPTRALLLVRPDGFCALARTGWPLADIAAYFTPRGLGDAAPVPSPALQELDHVQ